MRKSCIQSIILFAIILGLIIGAGSNTAFAQESTEEGDGDIKYDTTPYFQADDTGEGVVAMYDKHYNTTGHCSRVWGHEIENNITVDAMVRDVTYKSGEQVIRVAVNAYGHREEKGTFENDFWQHYTTKALEIHGELGEDAPDDAIIDLDNGFNRRGNMSGDNDIGGGEGDHDFWTDVAETGMSEFAGAVPVFGQFYTVSEFMTEHYVEGGSWKIFNPSGSGPGGDAGQAFEARPFNWPDVENADDIDGRDYFYVASTQFTVTVPGEIPDEMHISFSAKNVIGYWEGLIHWVNEDGAEASVEIPIKNAEPQLDENEVDVTNQPVKVLDENSDGEYRLKPDLWLHSGFLNNYAGCTDAEYDVKIEYSADGDTLNWKTYAFREGISIGDTISAHISIWIEDQGHSGFVDLKITVTAGDKYGSWEKQTYSTFQWAKHELTIDYSGMGTTDPTPGTYYYIDGESVTVEAEPFWGWDFYEWSG
ncbi:MAG: hypothetical protein V5A66_06265, partial [Candidatus Thermoplasmatota archaeon]